MSVFEYFLIGVVWAYSLLFLVVPARQLRNLPQRGGQEQRALKPVTGALKPATGALESPASGALESPASGAPETLAQPSLEVPRAEKTAPEVPWLVRLKLGLSQTRHQLFKGLDELFVSKATKVRREAALETLFELLIRSDVGVKTTDALVEAVRSKLGGDELSDIHEMKRVLKLEMLAIFEKASARQSVLVSGPYRHAESTTAPSPHVVMVVGVNGVGKTTTTGKLAKAMSDRGCRVVIGAADTFRAAAVEQLKIWSERAQAEFVTFKEGSDPAAVAFEAVKRATEIQAQFQEKRCVCFVDTAGRLHNRKDLMEELSKVKRVMGKNGSGAPHEVILVVDATTGQNAIMQAKTFMEVVDVSGLILTKLDGTAKGGVALAVAGDLGLPILYVGVGESVEDLQPFHSDEFIEALFNG